MKLTDTQYHQAQHFRGYMVVPQDVFDQVTPFLMTDQEKMHTLTRDMPVSISKPDWLKEGTEVKEWSGYLLVVKEQSEAIEAASTQPAGEA